MAIDHGEHDAAFEIYRKGGHKVEALTVLTDKCRDLNRAHEFATKADDPVVWSTLGHKQLEGGHVTDAIGSYLLAKDSSRYLEVIGKAKEVCSARACGVMAFTVPSMRRRTCGPAAAQDVRVLHCRAAFAALIRRMLATCGLASSTHLRACPCCTLICAILQRWNLLHCALALAAPAPRLTTGMRI